MGSKLKKERRRSRSSSREHKKKRKRSESTDESSASSGDFQKKLQDHRKEKREQKKVDKERRKEVETPEEKRARRLAKKLKKQEKRKQQVDDGYLPPSVPYTNLNNPFNDPKLSDTFVWKKKLDTEGRGDIKKKDLERETKDRVRKNLYEMEELKRNRDARLAAREDYDMIKRDQEKAMYGDWDKTEADFQLQQAKVRSQLRIEQNRAKPIDLLIRYIDYKDEPTEVDKTGDKEFELEDPFKYIRNLTIDDYEDLFEDIKVCRKIDGIKNADFWEDIITIASDELRRAKTSKKEAPTQVVQGDIEKVYKVCK
ncbi:unnamed protein product, partial [Mesorhabditis belari]|uniref:Splicing factor cactin central domain-containing protein n=1 Tax=Mesorhabditis belari TaxID=2138241 RepID=A0AAF3J6V6_9BILA